MIRYGASGWRGVLSDDFTFHCVRRVAHVLSQYVKENPEFGVASPEYRALLGGSKAPAPVVVIGYDTRFLAEELAHEAALVLASDGVKTLVSAGDLPTPAVGCVVRRHKAVGGLTVTGSRAPAEFGGMKWTPFWGGAAPPSITEDIDRRLELLGSHPIKTMAIDRSLRESWIVSTDFREEYFEQVLSLLDVKAIKKARLKVGVDVMHGAARLYLRPLLERLGVSVTALREKRDVLFGGQAPEPSPSSLAGLSDLVKRNRLHLGLACDGDGDRFGVLDAGGEWLSADDILGMVFEHLATRRGMRGKVVRSVVTSHFVDAVAKSHGLETRETQVGFRHIGEHLRTGQYLLGGEESGGLSIAGHVPDKDGILACLLVLEVACAEGVPLARFRDRLFKRVGAFHHGKDRLRLERSRQALEVEERLRVRPPLELAGGSVWRIDLSDGFKFILRDGSWLCVRSQPPEPVFRIYAEAPTPKKLDALLAAGKKLLQGRF
ncbi:MAG: phosphoglucomutase/phosphomannomutase family protein [Elusimicrobia bacterium]|nr:phosphoglucomutase/phosphomannomutase family protein [Elusimicrobiota bacterium]